jgi:hypothetical protein
MKLSVVIATCKDFYRLHFTIQALKMYHPVCASKDCEFIVFDNAPDTEDGRATKKFIEGPIRGKYFGFSSPQSSWNKYRTIPFADGEVVLGLDSHVLIQPGGIDKLLDYFARNPESKNLVQGQLLYDPLESGPTKLDERWSGHMKGVWVESKPLLTEGEFPINNMGMGLWAIRKQAWKGISPYFRGFGSEEWTIHRYIKHWGGETILLGGLSWWHSFQKIGDLPFKLTAEDRIFNFFLGAFDVYKTEDHPFYQEVREYFAAEKVSPELIDEMYQEAKKLAL